LQSYKQYKESGVDGLGKIPLDWKVLRLKNLCSVNDEQLAEDTDPDYEMLYVDIGSVDSSEGIQRKEPVKFCDAPSRARRRVRHGDVIISTVRTYLRAIAPIANPEPNLIVSTGFAVLRPLETLDSEFASFMLRAPYFVDSVVANSVGVGYPAINVRELVSLGVAVPPVGKQKTIATFLSKKTKSVDRLIAKKTRQIELLQEKRESIITQAVLEGLNPNTPTKQSGVEWLGEIPKDWKVARAKFVLKEVDERSKTGDEELLTVSHITGVTPRSEKNVNMFMAETLKGYKKCRTGDVIINTMWAWAGAVGATLQDGVVSPSYNVYRFRSEHSNPRYYDRLFRTHRFREEMKRHSKGVWESRLRLYPQDFFQIRTPIPPQPEQIAINDYLDKKLSRLDALLANIRNSILKLREYRNALVDAATTGKIDVTKGL
jgi:type I restriction enzyme, S subunit